MEQMQFITYFLTVNCVSFIYVFEVSNCYTFLSESPRTHPKFYTN